MFPFVFMRSRLSARATDTTRRLRSMASSAVSSRIVHARGIDFHVELRNSEPDKARHPILCMAGALGTAQTDFGPLLENGLRTSSEKDDDFTLIALDPRGLGKSGPKARDYPLDFYERDALDAHAVMQELGYSDFSVLGWSDGAIAGLHMAAHPDTKNSVRQLVVWGANAYVTKEDMEAWEAVRDVRSSWSERMLTERAAVVGSIDELQRLNDEVTDAYQDLVKLQNGDLCLAQLHKITCPTLVLHGAKDVICHMNHAAYISRQIMDASLTILEEGKHNLHLRHMDTFCRIVTEFLHSTNATGTTATKELPQPAIDDIAYAFMGSKALSVALQAGIFDAIDDISREKKEHNHNNNNGDTAFTASFEEIEQRCFSIKGERLKTLLSACVALNLVHRAVIAGQDAFRLPKASAQQLCRKSRRYWGDYITGQVDAQFYQRMVNLYEIMESGNSSSHGYEAWFEQVPDAARRYTQAQHNGSLATGYALWKRLQDLQLLHGDGSTDLRLLDVGGGSGAFSIAATRKLDKFSAVVLDLPNVISVAEEIIATEEASVRNRISTLVLSATAPGDWEGVVSDDSFDVVLMSYVSGSIPIQALSGLYANAFRALRPGGKVVIHDFFVDNAGDSPKSAALWALSHVTVNPEGMGLRPNRVIDILAKEGFIAPFVDDLIPGATQIIVAVKPPATI